MRKIFLDTGGILALVNKRDALHQKAVKVNAKLELDLILSEINENTAW
jgi:predicted nucleic acid-binding protein